MQHVWVGHSLRVLLMRQLLFIPLILLTYNSASAQQYYAAQDYPSPQQVAPQSAPGTMYYAGQPAYAPQYTGNTQPQATQQHVPPQNNTHPQPGEYGQSVMTDIRQMNF